MPPIYNDHWQIIRPITNGTKTDSSLKLPRDLKLWIKKINFKIKVNIESTLKPSSPGESKDSPKNQEF